MGIVDEGGFGPERIRAWARAQGSGKVLTYKGNPRIQGERPFRLSTEIPGLILARESYYHIMMLWTIYTQRPEGPGGWHLPQKIPADYMAQLCAWHPSDTSAHKFEEFEHWVSGGDDHYYDCEKMLLVLTDYIKQQLLPRAATAAARPVIVRRAGA
jgi:hypothetical protein